VLMTIDTESEPTKADLHSIAVSLQAILVQLGTLNATLKQIALCICDDRLASFEIDHSSPTKGENAMSKKLGSFGCKKTMRASGPSGDKDTVTIGGLLNTDGTPYTGPAPTITSTSSDPTTVSLDPPTGLTYGEHFLKTGTVTVTIVATATDGSGAVVTQSDTVTVTGVLGSFTATHSLPVVGP